MIVYYYDFDVISLVSSLLFLYYWFFVCFPHNWLEENIYIYIHSHYENSTTLYAKIMKNVEKLSKMEKYIM